MKFLGYCEFNSVYKKMTKKIFGFKHLNIETIKTIKPCKSPEDFLGNATNGINTLNRFPQLHACPVSAKQETITVFIEVNRHTVF